MHNALELNPMPSLDAGMSTQKRGIETTLGSTHTVSDPCSPKNNLCPPLGKPFSSLRQSALPSSSMWNSSTKTFSQLSLPIPSRSATSPTHLILSGQWTLLACSALMIGSMCQMPTISTSESSATSTLQPLRPELHIGTSLLGIYLARCPHLCKRLHQFLHILQTC